MSAPVAVNDDTRLDYVLVIEKCLASTGEPVFTVEGYHEDRTHRFIGSHPTLEAAAREACRVGYAEDCHSIRLVLRSEARS